MMFESKAWFTILFASHRVASRCLASKEAVSDVSHWNRKNPIQHVASEMASFDARRRDVRCIVNQA